MTSEQAAYKKQFELLREGIQKCGFQHGRMCSCQLCSARRRSERERPKRADNHVDSVPDVDWRSDATGFYA
jgi:hypothetical protein